MWQWQVLWEDYKGEIQAFYSLRGYKSLELTNQIMVMLIPKIQRELHKVGGNMISAQVIYSSKKLYDKPDKIL